jgi:hypothetical protein
MRIGLNGLRTVSTALAVFILASAGWRAEAQVVYGSIVGTVQNPTGAVVPGAQVSIANKETGQNRQTTSDDQGNYNITNVLPGRYDLTATATGFRTLITQNLDVTAGNIARADFRMEVGQLTEAVTVSAGAAQLQTEQAGTQSQITTKPVQVLPLSAYRNYQQHRLVRRTRPPILPAALYVRTSMYSCQYEYDPHRRSG